MDSVKKYFNDHIVPVFTFKKPTVPNSNTLFDFVGFATFFGAGPAREAIKFANINFIRRLASVAVIPGLYNVSTQVLKCSSFSVARFFSPGPREDTNKLMGLNSNKVYNFFGMQSGTRKFIENGLFEGWLNTSIKEINEDKSDFFRYTGKKGTEEDKRITIGIVTCEGYDSGVIHIWKTKNRGCYLLANWKESVRCLLAFLFQLITIFIFITIILCKGGTYGIIISALNMGCYCLIVIAVSFNVPSIPESDASKGVPPGDGIIADKEGNNIWVINGEERTVQSLIRYEVKYKHNGIFRQIVETIAATVGYATSIVTVLLTPLMFPRASICFAMQLLIGAIYNIVFSCRDNDKILRQLAESYYTFVTKERIVFTNRAAAIAAAVIKTKGHSANLGELVPSSTEDWMTYRELLNEITAIIRYKDFTNKYDTMCSTIVLDRTESANGFVKLFPNSRKLVQSKKSNYEKVDYEDFDCKGFDYEKWPARLVMDIVEGLQYVLKSEHQLSILEAKSFLHKPSASEATTSSALGTTECQSSTSGAIAEQQSSAENKEERTGHIIDIINFARHKIPRKVFSKLKR